jgi:hypothetical protein
MTIIRIKLAYEDMERAIREGSGMNTTTNATVSPDDPADPNMLASDYIAHAIRAKRTERILVQADVAERCAFAGLPHITSKQISEIETGTRKVSAVELWVICRVLNVDPRELLPPLPDFKDGHCYIAFPR